MEKFLPRESEIPAQRIGDPAQRIGDSCPENRRFLPRESEILPRESEIPAQRIGDSERITDGLFPGETDQLGWSHPRDVAEVRIFHEGRFLCRAVCQELAGETVPLREVIRRGAAAVASSAGRSRRRQVVESLLEARRGARPRGRRGPSRRSPRDLGLGAVTREVIEAARPSGGPAAVSRPSGPMSQKRRF